MSDHNELGKHYPNKSENLTDKQISTEQWESPNQEKLLFPESEYRVSHERLEDWVSFLVAKDLVVRAILEGKT